MKKIFNKFITWIINQFLLLILIMVKFWCWLKERKNNKDYTIHIDNRSKEQKIKDKLDKIHCRYKTIKSRIVLYDRIYSDKGIEHVAEKSKMDIKEMIDFINYDCDHKICDGCIKINICEILYKVYK